MRVTRERLESMSKFSSAKASVNTLDLYDEHNEPRGTRVEIEIPTKSY